MYIRIVIVLSLLLGGNYVGFAQTEIKGVVRDKATGEAVPGAAAIVLKQDSSTYKGGMTDINGRFTIPGVREGRYIVKITYTGYNNYFRSVVVGSGPVTLDVALEASVTQLKGVTIEGAQVRSVQKEDTTEFNAAAFKVNPDATAEDLARKMPGLTVENGTLKAQGEEVKKVLIDGKEFFGDDASMALRNLPAEVVEKMQIFDRLSEQAQFTGFDDGNSRKTLNIVTKGGLKQAAFGRFYAGVGTDNRYNSGGVFNKFNGNRRFTVLGQSNNLNQQNFSTEDLIGMTGGLQGGGGRGGGGNRMMMGHGVSDPSNFMVGAQNGINTTHSLGLNYIDSLGPKVKFAGSYFFNNSFNETEKDLARDFYLADTTSQSYTERSESWSNNLNHRLNLRLEVNFDSLTSMIYIPRVSWQSNQTGNFLDGETMRSGSLLSATRTDNLSLNQSYSMGHNLILRRRLGKTGRTISLSLNSDTQERNGESSMTSSNSFGFPDSTTRINQTSDIYYNARTFSGNLMYTEPLGKKAQLFLSYSPSYTAGTNEKNTEQLDPVSGEFLRSDTLLSNRFVKIMETQRGGGGLRFNSPKLTLMGNVNYEYQTLKGDQNYPFAQIIERTFTNILPMAMLNYKFSKTSNLRIFYRTNTNTPHISQLQNVPDNSNPLQLSTGNPLLTQEYSHNLNTRLGITMPKNSHSLFLNLNGRMTNNYIANSIVVAASDTLLPDGIFIRRGAQLTRPVNVNGYSTLRGLLTYSLPVKQLKSTLNLQTGATYSLTPGLVNGVQNKTANTGITGGIVVSSNISEKIDFTLSYNGGWNLVDNTLQPQLNNNYVTQNGALRANWMPWKGLVLNTDMSYYRFDGLNAFNQEFLLWNAGIGYKFLKNNAAEIRLSAYDILKQNTAINRLVTETYVEDSRTRVLTQYFLLTFTYNLRKLQTNTAPPDMPPHPGFNEGQPPFPRRF